MTMHRNGSFSLERCGTNEDENFKSASWQGIEAPSYGLRDAHLNDV